MLIKHAVINSEHFREYTLSLITYEDLISRALTYDT